MASEPMLVDARGMRCPWPALRAARMLRQVRDILIFADDPAAPAELLSLARQNGWQWREERTPQGRAFRISK